MLVFRMEEEDIEIKGMYWSSWEFLNKKNNKSVLILKEKYLEN